MARVAQDGRVRGAWSCGYIMSGRLLAERASQSDAERLPVSLSLTLLF